MTPSGGSDRGPGTLGNLGVLLAMAGAGMVIAGAREGGGIVCLIAVVLIVARLVYVAPLRRRAIVYRIQLVRYPGPVVLEEFVFSPPWQTGEWFTAAHDLVDWDRLGARLVIERIPR